MKQKRLTGVSLFCLVSGGYLFSRPRLPQCGKVVQRRRRSSNSLPYWISCSLHRPPDALTVDPITSPWLFDLARKYLLIKDQRKTPCAAWCSSLVSGGYLFSRPRLPQCGKVVQRRRRSSNSLPYWISCSLHRPPDALTVDPITSPWLFDLARKYLLIKDQRKTPCAAWCSSLVSGGYLFSRAVTSQVSSAYKGLTSVFGMRTGGSP